MKSFVVYIFAAWHRVCAIYRGFFLLFFVPFFTCMGTDCPLSILCNSASHWEGCYNHIFLFFFPLFYFSLLPPRTIGVAPVRNHCWLRMQDMCRLFRSTCAWRSGVHGTVGVVRWKLDIHSWTYKHSNREVGGSVRICSYDNDSWTSTALAGVRDSCCVLKITLVRFRV